MLRQIALALSLVVARAHLVTVFPDVAADTRKFIDKTEQFNPITDSFYIPPTALARALPSVGVDGALHSAATAIKEKKCLRVIAIGGSITMGASHNAKHPDRPRGPEDAYPVQLKRYLDHTFPCSDPKGHQVLNRGVYAVTSDYWVDKLADALHTSSAGGVASVDPSPLPIDMNVPTNVAQFSAELSSAHLVVVDTSVNDAFDLVNQARGGIFNSAVAADDTLPDDAQRSAKLNEIIAIMLLSRMPADTDASPGRGVVFLGTSSHNNAWSGGLRTSDTSHAQIPIAVHYGFPFVSAMEAFGPFDTPSRAAWFLDDYRTDGCCHVTSTGHAMLARLLMHAISVHAAPAVCCGAVGAPAGPPPTRSMPGPKLATREDIDLYMRSHPLYVSLTKTQPSSASGFEVAEDVPGKPGLIGSRVGDTASFVVPLDVAKSHAHVGVLHVQVVRGYDRMGTTHVSVTFSKSATQCTAELAGELASQNVDGLWETRSTQVTVETVPLNAALLHGDTSQWSGLCVQFSIAESVPRRAENKAKLLAFVLY